MPCNRIYMRYRIGKGVWGGGYLPVMSLVGLYTASKTPPFLSRFYFNNTDMVVSFLNPIFYVNVM